MRTFYFLKPSHLDTLTDLQYKQSLLNTHSKMLLRSSVRLLSTQTPKENLIANKVINNIASQSLQVDLTENDKAIVNYSECLGVYDLTHTEIPPKFKGQGLGHIFAEKVFEHIINVEKKKMRLSCEFLEAFYQKNRAKYEKFVVS